MKREESWATVDDVKRVFGVERTKATELIRAHLGGFKPLGLDAWRCTWKAIREYKRKNEQGGSSTWNSSDYPSSPERPRAEPIGTATSARLMIGDSSARSTSETTAAANQKRQPSPHSGKSKHEQQMESLIAKHGQRKRLERRVQRSRPSKPS